MGADGAVSACANLIATTHWGRRALRAAPDLESLAPAGLSPLARWHHPESADVATTLYSGRTRVDMSLWVGVGTDEPYEVEHPSVKEIYCAISTAEGFTVMTSAGPLTLRYLQGEWMCPQVDTPGLTVPELLTLPAGHLTSRVGERTFTKVTITRTGIDVPEGQLRAMAADLCGAYEEMAVAAGTGGLWMQPVAARILLRDADGNVLLESAPTMSRAKVQCTGLLSAVCTKPSADSVEVGPVTLTADAYRLKLRLTEATAGRLNAAGVRSVELWTSPQCHPVDASAEMPVRWTGVSTQQPSLTVAIPGATTHFASTQGAYARRIRAILSNPSAALTRRFVLSAPFSAGDYTVEAPAPEGVEADNRAAARADSAAATAVVATESASLLRSLQAPATFVARCGCVCGDKVMWANLTPLPPATVDLTNICTFDTALTGPWTAQVRVELGSGSGLHFTVSGTGNAPVGWAPVVAWPVADARAIDVYVTRLGKVLHGHAELEAAVDGSSAFSLDADFESRSWALFTGDIPEAEPYVADGRYAAAVAVAPLSAPAAPVKAALCCAAPVVAIVPAKRTLSAWDSAAARAYAFGAAGIFAINAGGAASTPLSSALVDRRPVNFGGTVASTPDEVLAASGSTLLMLSGTTVRSRSMPMDIRSVGWCYERSMAWLLDPAGNVALYDPREDTVASLLLPFTPEALTNVDASLAVVSAEGVWSIADASGERPVLWRRIVSVPCGYRVSSICIHASATGFAGSITLRAGFDAAAREDDIATVLGVDGALYGRVTARVDMPRRPVAVVEVSGRASCDFALYGITLNITRR